MYIVHVPSPLGAAAAASTSLLDPSYTMESVGYHTGEEAKERKKKTAEKGDGWIMMLMMMMHTYSPYKYSWGRRIISTYMYC